MRRLIIVDPSFTAHDGDRWQYAVDLANSARERGYEFVLLTHRAAPSIEKACGFKVHVRRVFDRSFYEHDKVYERHRAVLRRGDIKPSRMALKERLNVLETKERFARERGWVADARRIGRRITRLRRIERRLEERPRKPFGADRRSAKPFNRDDFALALARELDRLRPGPTDIVFFHTMTYGMMESLSEVTAARGHKPPFDTSAYFLFHFGAEAPDARTFLDRYYSYSAYGSINERMAVGSPFRHLHYLATNEPLQVEASEILGAPVSLWHGLVNPRYFTDVLGGTEKLAELRRHVEEDLNNGEISVVVRAADLSFSSARSVSRACHLVQHRGNVVRLKILYHAGSVSRLREIITAVDFPNIEFVDTNKNEEYLRQISRATIVILPYDVSKYAKRVSAVLHDCAVIGVPVMVPYGTTLCNADYAVKFIFGSEAELVGTLLYATRILQRRGIASPAKARLARELLAGNAIDRLLECAPVASLTRPAEPAPIANIVSPLWGRVGSSYAMEAQCRYLLTRGYFVNQIFLFDKPAAREEVAEYFWKMLRENSVYCRGSIQRIAFRTHERHAQRVTARYLQSGAFRQLLMRYAMNSTEDKAFNRQIKSARLTVVNHVFHGAWAFKHCGGRKILETHDIQSYQMAAWPLINEHTNHPDSLSALLNEELKAVAKYDHVVNVAHEEDAIIRSVNLHASLITPYIPESRRSTKYRAVWDMAYTLNLHESYRSVNTFDLYIAADSHQANRESVMWFVREVFIPYLAPAGVTLVLAGRISDYIHEQLGAVSHLFYIGFFEDIASLRALSKLAVLPDKRGTGISIKALEAMACGMPFVATSVSLRGIKSRLPDSMSAFDAPAEFANEILRLLNNQAELELAAYHAREAYQRLAGRTQFDEAWDRVIEDALRPRRKRYDAIGRELWRRIRFR